MPVCWKASVRSRRWSSDIWRTSHQTDKCGTRPFLVGPAQGRSPHASGSPKKAFGPVGPPKEGSLGHQAINLTSPRRVKTWGGGPLRPEEINRPAQMPDSLLIRLYTKQRLIEQVFVIRPTKRTSVAQGLFEAGPGTGPKPTRVRPLQKCLKEGSLRHLAINLTPPMRVNAWRDAPWGSRKLTIWHECQTVWWKASTRSSG